MKIWSKAPKNTKKLSKSYSTRVDFQFSILSQARLNLNSGNKKKKNTMSLAKEGAKIRAAWLLQQLKKKLANNTLHSSDGCSSNSNRPKATHSGSDSYIFLHLRKIESEAPKSRRKYK